MPQWNFLHGDFTTLARERGLVADLVVCMDVLIHQHDPAYYEQFVLLDQPSIRDPKVTIGQVVTAAIAKLGENVAIPRFARFKLGETN